MNVPFLGVSRRFGKSSKTGNQYDICVLHYARPIKPKTTDNYTFVGHGFTEGEFPMDPDALEEFKGLDIGTNVELNFGMNPDNPQRNWVIGFDN